jgi:hypothetical protein
VQNTKFQNPEINTWHLDKEFDGVILPMAAPIVEYVVFEPEQIHVLGSKQDIEGFKQFINKPQQPPLNVMQDPQTTFHNLSLNTVLMDSNFQFAEEFTEEQEQELVDRVDNCDL